ncbi:MAG TPA: zinc-dependent metalloprotease, partial [Gillisia sp.]|nr:zinc-dependent metalloprotease [Gillisia sp.]
GEVSLDNAYDTGIGAWDKITVKYSYADIPEGSSEKEFLNSVLAEANEKGLQFISDSDARDNGGAHLNAHLWDNGKNAAEELFRVLQVRKVAISNFSEDNFRVGEPYTVLEDVFVPLYFFHRYQTEAAVKLIGGLDYNYAVKGGGQNVVEMLSSNIQEEALTAVLQTLNAEHLAIPKAKLQLFPPRAFGYSRSRESFKSNTGVSFDALGAAGTASNLTLSLLLHPERAARLVQNQAVNNDQPGLKKVLKELISKTIGAAQKDPYFQEVQNTINYNVLQHLMNLAVHKDATPQVKAEVNAVISELETLLEGKKETFYRQLLLEVREFRKNPSKFKAMPSAPQIPDGSPIGSVMCDLYNVISFVINHSEKNK